MTKSYDQIRREGLAALRKKLGRAGTIRFMQQFELGSGDYSKERHQWAASVDLDRLLSDVKKKRRRVRARKR